MKKNIIAITSAFTIAAYLAGTVKPLHRAFADTLKGFVIEYNDEASTETERVINVYMSGIDNFFTSEMSFDVPDEVTGASFGFDIDKDVNGDTLVKGGNLASNTVYFKVIANDYVDIEADRSVKIGTITLTVKDGTPDFDIVLKTNIIMDKDEEYPAKGVDLSATRITVKNPVGSDAYDESGDVTAEPTNEPTTAPTVKPSSDSGSGKSGGGGGGHSTGSAAVKSTEAPKTEVASFTWASYDISVNSGEAVSIELYEDSNKNRPVFTLKGNLDGTASAVYENEKGSYTLKDTLKCGIVYQVSFKIPIVDGNSLNTSDYNIFIKK